MTDKDQTVNRFKYRTQIGVAAKDRKGDPRETPSQKMEETFRCQRRKGDPRETPSQKMEETKAAHDHAPRGKKRRT